MLKIWTKQKLSQNVGRNKISCVFFPVPVSCCCPTDSTVSFVLLNVQFDFIVWRFDPETREQIFLHPELKLQLLIQSVIYCYLRFFHTCTWKKCKIILRSIKNNQFLNTDGGFHQEPAVHKYIHQFITVFIRIIKVQFKLQKSDHIQPHGQLTSVQLKITVDINALIRSNTSRPVQQSTVNQVELSHLSSRLHSAGGSLGPLGFWIRQLNPENTKNTQTVTGRHAEVNADMDVAEVMSRTLPACRIYQCLNLTVELLIFWPTYGGLTVWSTC